MVILPSESEIQERVVGGIDKIGHAQHKHGKGRRIRGDRRQARSTLQRAVEHALGRWETGDHADHQENGVAENLVQIGAAHPSTARAEHGAEVGKSRRAVLKDEDQPADDDKEQGINVLQDAGKSLQPLPEEKFFRRQQQEEIQAPQQIIPARAVPKAGQKPDDGKISVGAKPTASVAACTASGTGKVKSLSNVDQLLPLLIS